MFLSTVLLLSAYSILYYYLTLYRYGKILIDTSTCAFFKGAEAEIDERVFVDCL